MLAYLMVIRGASTHPPPEGREFKGERFVAGDRSNRVPAISVILPVFNAKDTLDRAISSIRGQNFTDLELLVLDDGSTDCSAEVAEAAGAGDHRVRIVRCEHNGLIATLNHGLKIAKGPLIARMDADDFSLPDRFEKQVAFLRDNPGVAVVGGAALIIGSTESAGSLIRHPLTPTAVAQAMESASALVHPTVLMRRAALEEVGMYRAPFLGAEDYDLWLRLVEHFDLANLEDILLHYTAGGSQESVIRAQQQIFSTMAARHCHQIRMTGRPEPAAAKTISRTWLIDNGMAEDTVDDLVLRDLAHRSWWLAEAGLLGEAEIIAHGIEEVPVHPSRKNRRTFTSTWALARIEVKRGTKRRAAGLFARAALLDPGEVAGRSLAVIRRKVRRFSASDKEKRVIT